MPTSIKNRSKFVVTGFKVVDGSFIELERFETTCKESAFKMLVRSKVVNMADWSNCQIQLSFINNIGNVSEIWLKPIHKQGHYLLTNSSYVDND